MTEEKRELTDLEREFMASFEEGNKKISEKMKEYREVKQSMEEQLVALSDQYNIPVVFTWDYVYVPDAYAKNLEYFSREDETPDDYDEWPDELRKFHEDGNLIELPYQCYEWGLEGGYWENSNC